jgi:PPOX class probable F420-dependent enzyme
MGSLIPDTGEVTAVPPMTPEEMEQFLHGGPWVAKLGTLLADGGPYVTPVWYEWDGRYFWVIGKPLALYVQNVKKDSRVALVIDKEEFPYRRVSVIGTGEVVAETWEQRWIDMANHMSMRYVGEAGRKYAGERLKYGVSVIRITPRKMNTWKVTRFPPDRTFTKPVIWKEVG